MDPASLWLLVRFVSTELRRELLQALFEGGRGEAFCVVRCLLSIFLTGRCSKPVSIPTALPLTPTPASVRRASPVLLWRYDRLPSRACTSMESVCSCSSSPKSGPCTCRVQGPGTPARTPTACGQSCSWQLPRLSPLAPETQPQSRADSISQPPERLLTLIQLLGKMHSSPRLRQPSAKKLKASANLNPSIPSASQGERKAPAQSCDSHPRPRGRRSGGSRANLSREGWAPSILAESAAGLEKKLSFPTQAKGRVARVGFLPYKTAIVLVSRDVPCPGRGGRPCLSASSTSTVGTSSLNTGPHKRVWLPCRGRNSPGHLCGEGHSCVVPRVLPIRAELLPGGAWEGTGQRQLDKEETSCPFSCRAAPVLSTSYIVFSFQPDFSPRTW